ncbi:MAG: transcriptional regulator [Acidobacteriota bacterium]
MTSNETPTFESLGDIDRTIHEPARLLVMSHLSVLESADFLYLARQTGLTRGNLSSHMRKLEEAGYVDVEKTFVDRLPLTVFRLTEAGRKALETYREQMTQVLQSLG